MPYAQGMNNIYRCTSVQLHSFTHQVCHVSFLFYRGSLGTTDAVCFSSYVSNAFSFNLYKFICLKLK